MAHEFRFLLTSSPQIEYIYLKIMHNEANAANEAKDLFRSIVDVPTHVEKYCGRRVLNKRYLVNDQER